MPAKKTPPWKRPNPKSGASAKLTDAQKHAARKRAKRAGRRYPNLVDNMWASQRKAKGKHEGD